MRFTPLRNSKTIILSFLRTFLPPNAYSRVIAFLIRMVSPEQEIKWLSSVLKPGMNVVDIGANLGTYTITASKIVGNHGRVHAFEPVEKTFQLLRKNCRNRINITLYQVALSDHKGTETILIPKGPRDSILSTSALKRTASQIQRTDDYIKIEIPVTTLDSIIPRDIPIHFIKCDVEGHEFEVIKGALETIRKHYPIILIEILREKWVCKKAAQSEIGKLLLDLGYNIFQYDGEKLVGEKDFSKKKENFIFIFRFAF